jgi:hypothetical protein
MTSLLAGKVSSLLRGHSAIHAIIINYLLTIAYDASICRHPSLFPDMGLKYFFKNHMHLERNPCQEQAIQLFCKRCLQQEMRASVAQMNAGS